ncbi:MAG: hypothetical protein RR365_11680 [Bacteroides sp.]
MDKNSNRQNRKTLKSYFKKGDVPTEAQFAELIDSVPNIMDDGQAARTAEGWAFHPAQSGRLDLDLYNEEFKGNGEKPAWVISVTEDKRLVIGNEKKEAVIEVLQDKTVKIHSGDEPKPITDDGYFTLPADKGWHDVPINFPQENPCCCVFNIYASCIDNIGIYQLTRATVVWMDKMEQWVESPQKHWWGWFGCIRIRWNGGSKLQIRTKRRLGGEVQCRIIEVYKAQEIKNKK